MDRSESINELVTALAKAQAAMTAVGKGNRANIPTKAGGSYSYTYADLADIVDAIRKPLTDNGLAIMQSPTVTDRSVDVETVLAHTSGQWAACSVAVAIADRDAKAIGSAITYGRRYGLCLIGVVTDEDDDGQAASKPGKAQAAPTNGNGRPRTQTEQRAQESEQQAPDYIPNGDMITEAQIQKLSVLIKELYPKADDMETVRKWMTAEYGVASRKDLTKAQASAMIDTLEKQKNGEPF